MNLIDFNRSVLVLVDYQPRLMPAIHEGDAVLAQATRLTEVAATLGVPILGTQQNPSRLGELDPALAKHCAKVVDKMHFDACGGGLVDEVRRALASGDADRGHVVIAGCEAHVCLLQTALTLLDRGFTVWVCTDACGSRIPSSHEVAMRRLELSGAIPVTVEMVAFEWMRTCENTHFKAVQALIK